ncbi:MAG TPA: hypothetical protein VHN20_04485, partial [Beijerinckiaceae bacterium]|nr:hypothetical protein [Beijerinckiaceae bacterium]
MGAALAAGAVLYVADWRPDLATDGKPLQSQPAPAGARQAASAATSSSRADTRDPAATGSVEPARRRSSDAKPVEAKPVEAKPIEAKPIEANPIEAKSIEVKPVESKPTETRPPEGKPIDTKSAETRLAEARPAPVDQRTRREPAVAEARQPRTVGPPAVLLAPSRDPSGEKGERLGPAARDAAASESAAPK